MHRFNVATFVNILIVGLVALTISLFVFGGRPHRQASPSGASAGNADVASVDEPLENVEEVEEVEVAGNGATEETGEANESAIVETSARESNVDVAESDALETTDGDAAAEADGVALDSTWDDEAVEEFGADDVLLTDDAVEAEGDALETDVVLDSNDGAEAAVEPTDDAVEVAALESIFAEEVVEDVAAVESNEPTESAADAEEEPLGVENSGIDALFADDAIEFEEESEFEADVLNEENGAESVAAEVADVAEDVELDDLLAADVEEVAEPVAAEVSDVEEVAEPLAAEVADVEEVAEPVASEVADVEEIAEPVASDVADVEEVAEVVELDDLFAADVEEVAEPVVSDVADVAESAEPVAEVVELDDLFASDVAEVADAEEVSEPVASDVADAEEVAEPVASEVADVEEIAEPVASEVADVEEIAEPVAEVADVANVEEVAEPVASDVADVAEAEEVSEPVASDVANVEEIAEPVASDVADVEEVAEPVASDVADVEEVAEPVAEVADVANVEEVAEPVAADVADVESVAVEAEFVAVSGSAEGNDVVPVVRENEFWIVGQNGNGFYLYRLQDGVWNAKNLDEFYADAAEFATVVYAHGYQTDMSDATRDAVVFKSVLDAARRNVGSDRAFRLVVWKWDSERDAARIRIDAQSKAALADWSGKALGRFLGGVDSNADLALVGFSFGARVVGSALETLAQNGAQAAALDVEFDENDEFAFAVSGRLVADAAVQETTAQENDDRQADANEGRKIALILVAAACDLGSFETRGVYGRGATLPTDVLNVYNPNDFALKYYRHVSETRSDAQGVAPVRAGVFPNAVGKTFNINSNPTLGKRHSFVDAIGTVPTQTLGALAF